MAREKRNKKQTTSAGSGVVSTDTAEFELPDDYAPATVLVTHHLEEIPEGMTHALLLKKGRVVAAGPIEETLTDALLSETFDMPLTVTNDHGRWSARAVRPAGEG